AMPDRRGGGLHRGYYMAGKTVKKPGADHLFPPGPGRLRRVISPITQYGPKIPCPERGVGSRQVRAGIDPLHAGVAADPEFSRGNGYGQHPRSRDPAFESEIGPQALAQIEGGDTGIKGHVEEAALGLKTDRPVPVQ